jgi:SAM-dependent methyltransferase
MEPDRGLRFGSVAEEYERYRPGYPKELVPLVVAAADGPVERAIEVGAGTGKATRVVAGAGIAVTAVEPDPAMLAVLRRECAGLPVTAVQATFEALDPGDLGTFDLLYAAAAWHWTDPQQRWTRAAALLRPGGAVAVFGGPYAIDDPVVAAREAETEAGYLVGGHHVPSPSPRRGPLGWPGDELLADPRFGDVREQRIRRRFTAERDDYVGYLTTVSAYRMLSDADRTALVAELRRVLPERVPVAADLIVHTARRVAG